MNQDIIVTPTFDIKSTFKASLLVFKNQKIALYGIAILLFLILNFYLKDALDLINLWVPLLVFILFISFTIYSIYKTSKRQIQENPRLKEKIIYILNEDYFQEKGETFEVKHFWKDIFKVVEKNEFFLIYTYKNRANFIKKSDLRNNQLNDLKELFNSLNIKKSLK
ncbi:YcxB family protein [Flavobacterium okayamense]|uniref:YcxB-like C-terminal domain-containing protein n=1 Tax=Flavobacterium okayamense TaxID=2830782 RepID=A0ABM7S446_9FLAO|nr:YcxB family protein [Flavobacterium okayamense]BCY28285.1 hypothetical protein KK2020170_11530 [Flavobacterium okayamense]